jgi:hypothetical protein
VARLVGTAVLVVGGLLQASAFAQAQVTAPTDVELRAAYCTPVINTRIDVLQKAITANESNVIHAPTADQRETFQHFLDQQRTEMAEQRATQNRLKSYLAPRTMTVDPIAMAAVAKRGEADARALVDSYQCQTACIFKILPALDKEKRDACTKSCVGDDVLARMQPCHETSWLPP